MNVFSYPLRYVWLRAENGKRLLNRDGLGVLVLAVVLSLPFWLTNANYYGLGGFLDRFGSFAGVLTGFYVAALVGVASFATPKLGIDNLIAVGPVFDHSKKPPKSLTRREYVCAMFGYLAFMALMSSLAAILAAVVAPDIGAGLRNLLPLSAFRIISGIILFAFNLVIAHMVATTCHGLYYLIDKIYTPKIVTFDQEGRPMQDDRR
jgi:hypothetical protein